MQVDTQNRLHCWLNAFIFLENEQRKKRSKCLVWSSNVFLFVWTVLHPLHFQDLNISFTIKKTTRRKRRKKLVTQKLLLLFLLLCVRNFMFSSALSFSFQFGFIIVHKIRYFYLFSLQSLRPSSHVIIWLSFSISLSMCCVEVLLVSFILSFVYSEPFFVFVDFLGNAKQKKGRDVITFQTQIKSRKKKWQFRRFIIILTFKFFFPLFGLCCNLIGFIVFVGEFVYCSIKNNEMKQERFLLFRLLVEMIFFNYINTNQRMR